MLTLKKYRFTTIFTLALFSLMLVACSEDDENARDIVLPSGLTLTLVEDTANLGSVTATASASMANFYTIIFYDKGKSRSFENKDGEATYEFKEAGTYTVTAKAHTDLANSIQTSRTINITLGQSGGGGTDTTGGAPTSGYTTPLTYPNYSLVWNDEFDGTSLNSNNWVYDIGTGSNGWGNNELQYYRQENVSVANGILTIEAKAESFGGKQYTSTRIKTQGKQSFQYGRIDIRAAMPFGQGIWPALWMLGDNFSTIGWPKCGEIDIMEMVGGSVTNGGDSTVHGTAHWEDANGTKADFGGSTTLSSGILADEWHVYTIIWDAQKIQWYFDDVKYHEIDITPAGLSEFREKFFFIFNVAVGGTWPGPPNGTTSFPQKMYVDYVRVFQ